VEVPEVFKFFLGWEERAGDLDEVDPTGWCELDPGRFKGESEVVFNCLN
jgi:hypothetical protein